MEALNKKLSLSSYILTLRKNLLALSVFILFYKLSGAKMGSIFGINITFTDIDFLHKALFFYLLYNLIYFFLSIIFYLVKFFLQFNLALANFHHDPPMDDHNYDDHYMDDDINKIREYYDKAIRKTTNIEVIVIFLLIECILPIVLSVWALILLPIN